MIWSRFFGFRKPISRGSFAFIATFSVLTLLVAWWLTSKAGVFSESFFPAPEKVVETGAQMFLQDGFGKDVLVSTARIFVAFVVSALVAIPIGVLMSCFKPIEGIVAPLVEFIRYIPVPALLPLFVLWAGIGESPKFLVLFFGTFFQLVLLIKDDADNVPQVYFDLAKTMGAKPMELMRDVLIPYMLPQMYDRLRVTLGWCWTYLVIAELIAAQLGVGHVIKEAQRFNSPGKLFVCFIVLGLIGLLTDVVAKYGYRVLFPHSEKVRSAA